MTLREFLTWWKAQLLSLLPHGLIGGLARSGQRITLTIDGAQTTIAPADIDQARPLRSGDPEPSAWAREAENLLLKVGPDDYLLRQVTLPRLALSNLAEAVGYQLPKLMPFSRDQVLFACGSDADQASGDQASVWLVVVPKRRVADALATLGIPLPENPITMRRPPRAGETLEWSWRLDSQREGRKRLQTTLWWGLAAIWIVAGALTVYGQQRDFTSLEATHDELRREAAVVGQMRERLDLAQQQLDGLLQKRQQTITPLQLLNELTETLDDATWLTNVELQDDKLSLQGVSPTPAALIETLEDTALLRDVQFDAAITQAAAGEGRRFNISARLASADPEGLR